MHFDVSRQFLTETHLVAHDMVELLRRKRTHFLVERTKYEDDDGGTGHLSHFRQLV